MTAVGRVESVWRYPFKSMRGEELQEAFAGFGGLRGDRVYAIGDSKARQDFPYFTAREQGRVLLCRRSIATGAKPIWRSKLPVARSSVSRIRGCSNRSARGCPTGSNSR